VEIALVAEDAAYRIAVDAGCEQLAARPTSRRASASAMCATRSGCWSGSRRRC